MKTKDTITRLGTIEDEKKRIIEKIRKLRMGDNLKPLDLSCPLPTGFSEYEQGVFVREITCPAQKDIGVTVLHVKVKEKREFVLHEHENQSQSLYVKKGKVFDTVKNKIIRQGETHFVDKREKHELRYIADSELIFVYLPNLEQI